MAQEIKNSVLVEGYLKENNLQLTKNDEGAEIIKGSITIAVDDHNAIRIQTYVNKMKKTENNKQEESKTFPKWIELLPEKTISIESYLKDNPKATFVDAAASANKVYVRGTMEEYAVKDGGKEVSYISVKGLAAGFKTEASKNQFSPKAEFTISMFIEEIKEEIGENEEETGKIIVVGLTPNYDESVSRISYISGSEEIASYIRDNYEVGQTAYLTGDLVNIVVTTVKEQGAASFGRKPEDQVETKFSNERRIFGGSPTPLSIDDEGAIKKSVITSGLVKRAEKIAENTERKNNNSGTEAKKGFGVDGIPTKKSVATDKKADKKFVF